ncbi:MAG TPA: cytochrome c oxidase assembly protein [Thermoleophilaceae bacterium]|nr:cytochrome c oxidase assembly protein [Thermoleophilaceae bacterium]
MGFSFDPAVIALLLGAVALYARAVRVLAARGYKVPAGQRAAWYAGIGLTAAGLLSPIDGLGEELLLAHMGQHLLIADLAAPLLLIGARSPVYAFLLPRPVLVPLARRTGLRRLLRKLRRPLVAIPVWVAILYGWHLQFAFEAALRNDFVHALQHQSFVLGALLVWWSVIEPKRRRLPGELWKVPYILGARLSGMFLGMAFILLRTPAYVDFYGRTAPEHGFSPITDQQVAGAMMLGLDLLVMLFCLGFIFYRSGEDEDRAHQVDGAAVPG